MTSRMRALLRPLQEWARNFSGPQEQSLVDPIRFMSLGRDRRLEPIASADGRHLEMKRGVLRKSTIIDQRFRRLLGGADADENRTPGGLFAEVATKTALTGMN